MNKLLISLIMVFTALLIVVYVVSGLTASNPDLAESPKKGFHNIQIELDSPNFPFISNSNGETRVFNLPEISGFKSIYKHFNVVEAKLIANCNEECSLIVNGRTCITNIQSEQLYDLPCTDLFTDGINVITLDLSTTLGHMEWLFIKSEIVEP